MDRRVKERLVGASILVVIIVWVVPELLSGPAPRPASPPPAPQPALATAPIRNVTLDLRTSQAPAQVPLEGAASVAQPTDGHEVAPGAAVEPASSAAASPGTVPPSPASAPGATTPAAASAAPPSDAARPVEAQPAEAPLESAAPPPTFEVTAAKPAAAGGVWAVQLGSFKSRDNAERLLRQLKAQGFAAYELSGGVGPALRYRVRVGPMVDHGAAAQALAKLKSAGHAATIVSPGT
jgi:DedD protein